MTETVKVFLSTRSDAERKLFAMRLGAEEYPSLLEEVAAALGITREQARRMEAELMRALRHDPGFAAERAGRKAAKAEPDG